MQASRFKRTDKVRFKGSSRGFTVEAVYYLVDCPDRASGFYYSGENEKDVHESKIDFDNENGAQLSDVRFSENLRALIEKHNVSFTQLSMGAGVSRSSCYDAAYKGAPTKVSTLVNLARYFKVSIDELMFGKIDGSKTSGGSTDA